MESQNAFALYSKHSHLYTFKTVYGTVLFTLLSYDKCKIAQKICNAYPSLAPTIEDNIWEECVIEHSFPNSIDSMNAGLVSTIVRLILRLSIPSSKEEATAKLEEFRNSQMDIRDEIVIKICQAFPAYKPEEVEALDWQLQLKRLAQAEKILNTTFEISTNDTAPNQDYIDFEKENKLLKTVL